MGASLLCVLHCMLTPVLLSFSAAFAHFLPGEEVTHRVLAVAIACLGCLALILGFRKHRRSRILWLMATGLVCIFAAAWFGDSFPAHWNEVALTFVGSGFMIGAHRLNHTFCRDCECSSAASGKPQGNAVCRAQAD